MKKRVLAGIMMAVMMMASVMSVSAANSKTDEVSMGGQSSTAYKATAVADETVKASATAAAKKANKQIITATPVWNVSEASTGAGTANSNGKYEVTLSVSSLTKNCSNIEVLCYNESTQAWTSIKVDASKVDYDNKTIVVELENPSATIAICATVAAGGSTGTSPSTGVVSSAWLICLAVAIVAVGVVTISKSRS